MSEEKRVVDERKYALLSRDSVRVFAEAAGHSDISESVAALLAEDVSFRLREATQNCYQYMKHAKRRRLTTDDVNKALSSSDVEKIYGYGSPDPLPFYRTREGEIHFQEELDVSLVNVATTPVHAGTPGQTSVKGTWLAVEGIPKTLSATQSSIGKSSIKCPSVSEDLKMYYERMAVAILGTDEESMKIALEDLRTNPRIAPLIPYFVNFVVQGIKTVNHDTTQLMKLLHTVKSLISNPTLFLEPKPYLNLLVHSIQYCVLEPLAASMNPTNDHWILRDYAARLLAQLIREWTSPANQLLYRQVKGYAETLKDHSKSFCSHYGAVMGLIALGVKHVEEKVLTELSTYWPHLEVALKDNSYDNAHTKMQAMKVHGALMLAARLVLYSKGCALTTENHWNGFEREKGPAKQVSVKSEPVKGRMILQRDRKSFEKSESDVQKQGHKTESKGSFIRRPSWKAERYQPKSLKDLYDEMYGYFGDSLTGYLPLMQAEIDRPLLRDKKLLSLADVDAAKSGEELLADFLRAGEKQDEEMKSEPSDIKSEKSSEDNSFFLDSDSRSMDLTVKSTANDPAKGIKLIISKRPKSKHDKDKQKSDRRKRKQNTKAIKLEHVFDKVTMVQRYTPFTFKFRGATQIYTQTKKNLGAVPESANVTPDTRVCRLAIKMGPRGKKKRPILKRNPVPVASVHQGRNIDRILYNL